ncbi:class I SAM-dependent methyltransferase [Streptomyces sp. NPDC018584]|uniref:class I SAM-dependent methyltransferase n=1 Tax=unclassified Streptomyces TaxID=2593676 RepID=UPI00379C3225
MLDVGGGPGAHAQWLVEEGYEVHLVGPVQKHGEQACERAPGCVATQGEALQLDFPARSFDVMLLLGPLYHLAERADRLRALREARGLRCRVVSRRDRPRDRPGSRRRSQRR